MVGGGGEGLVRTNIGVEMVVETTKSFAQKVAEVALITFAGPRRFASSELDWGGIRQISKIGPLGDSAVGVLGSHQFVHLVAVHVRRAGAVTVLDVLRDCSGVGVRVSAAGALDDAIAVDTRIQVLLEGFGSATV